MSLYPEKSLNNPEVDYFSVFDGIFLEKCHVGNVHYLTTRFVLSTIIRTIISMIICINHNI